ncbi:unnamed protein product [Gordionus sp. m RMFG-2023]
MTLITTDITFANDDDDEKKSKEGSSLSHFRECLISCVRWLADKNHRRRTRSLDDKLRDSEEAPLDARLILHIPLDFDRMAGEQRLSFDVNSLYINMGKRGNEFRSTNMGKRRNKFRSTKHNKCRPCPSYVGRAKKKSSTGLIPRIEVPLTTFDMFPSSTSSDMFPSSTYSDMSSSKDVSNHIFLSTRPTQKEFIIKDVSIHISLSTHTTRNAFIVLFPKTLEPEVVEPAEFSRKIRSTEIVGKLLSENLSSSLEYLKSTPAFNVAGKKIIKAYVPSKKVKINRFKMKKKKPKMMKATISILSIPPTTFIPSYILPNISNTEMSNLLKISNIMPQNYSYGHLTDATKQISQKSFWPETKLIEETTILKPIVFNQTLEELETTTPSSSKLLDIRSSTRPSINATLESTLTRMAENKSETSSLFLTEMMNMTNATKITSVIIPTNITFVEPVLVENIRTTNNAKWLFATRNTYNVKWPFATRNYFKKISKHKHKFKVKKLTPSKVSKSTTLIIESSPNKIYALTTKKSIRKHKKHKKTHMRKYINITSFLVTAPTPVITKEKNKTEISIQTKLATLSTRRKKPERRPKKPRIMMVTKNKESVKPEFTVITTTLPTTYLITEIILITKKPLLEEETRKWEKLMKIARKKYKMIPPTNETPMGTLYLVKTSAISVTQNRLNITKNARVLDTERKVKLVGEMIKKSIERKNKAAISKTQRKNLEGGPSPKDQVLGGALFEAAELFNPFSKFIRDKKPESHMDDSINALVTSITSIKPWVPINLMINGDIESNNKIEDHKYDNMAKLNASQIIHDQFLASVSSSNCNKGYRFPLSPNTPLNSKFLNTHDCNYGIPNIPNNVDISLSGQKSPREGWEMSDKLINENLVNSYKIQQRHVTLYSPILFENHHN